MNIKILSVNKKPPVWVNTASHELLKRFPKSWQISLVAIPPSQRYNGINHAIQQEGENLLKKVTSDALLIALDPIGKSFTTTQLANNIVNWQQDYQDINFIIGGADGLSDDCRKAASINWSLSKLTFPHNLVKVILLEQLYRAWSIINSHPYHRA